MEQFTIGRLAKKAGVNIETVRYYERRRLLPKPGRTSSGYRQYTDEGVRRIRFIRHAQELGFSLKEIQGLLNLRIDPKVTCADVEKRTEEKIVDIDRKITTLKRMRQVLIGLKASCKGNVPSSECPILEALESV
jgi:MerR family transcriptional regulator, copper efflux regulator